MKQLLKTKKSITTITSISIFAMFMILATLAIVPSVSADTIDVPGDQSTIQDAIDAADPGDTVELVSGFFHDRTLVEIDKDLTINGNGYFLDGGIDIISGAEVFINDLSIKDIDATDISAFSSLSSSGNEWIIVGVRSGKLTATNLNIDQERDDAQEKVNLVGISVQPGSELVLEDSTFTLSNINNGIVYGVYAQGNSGPVVVKNNVFNLFSNRRIVGIGTGFNNPGEIPTIQNKNNDLNPTGTGPYFIAQLGYWGSTMSRDDLNSSADDILNEGETSNMYNQGWYEYIPPIPTINFIMPTPDGTNNPNYPYIGETDATINVETTSSGQRSAFINWDNSLVGYWPLNDVYGTLAEDNSTYDNDGTLTNGPVWTDGKFGNALEFDGTDDYVLVDDGPSLDITNNLTVEAWFNIDSLPTSADMKSIVSKDTNYEFHVENNGTIYWWWHNAFGKEHKFYSSSTITPGQWHHVAVVYTDGHQKLYLDGNLDAESYHTGLLETNTNDLHIGQNQGSSGRWFNGKIDEVRIWNRVLSEQEIKASYDNSVSDLEATFTGLQECVSYPYYAQVQNVCGFMNWTPSQQVIVDTTAPTFEWSLQGPQNHSYEYPFIGPNTVLWLNSTDSDGHCGVGSCWLNYSVETQDETYSYTVEDGSDDDENDAEGEISVKVTFDESCWHEVHVWVEDCLGNTYTGHVAEFDLYVDAEEPSTDSEFIGPHIYIEPTNPNAPGEHWVNLTTVKRLYGNDAGCLPFGSGAETIGWQIEYDADGDGGMEVYRTGSVNDGENGKDIDTSYGNITFDLSFLTECHHIVYHEVTDYFGNKLEWGGTDTKQHVYVDNTPPNITKIVGMPNCSHLDLECGCLQTGDYCVEMNTPIIISAVDEGCEGGVGMHETEPLKYRVWDGSTWTNWFDIDPNGETIQPFEEECKHYLEIKAKDKLGNTIIDNETFYVDETPPHITKIVGDPNVSGDGTPDYWVTMETGITADVYDLPLNCCPCDVSVYYKVWNITDGQQEENIDWIEWSDPTTEITPFDGNCEHGLSIKAVDCLGHVNYDNETFYVDDNPPTSTKEVGQPNCTGCDLESDDYCINSTTPIWINASDNELIPCDIGEYTIHWKIWNVTGDYLYNEGIQHNQDVILYIDETCEHNVSYWVNDTLGNRWPTEDEGWHEETFYVDDQEPEIDKVVTLPKCDNPDGADLCVTTDTAIYFTAGDNGCCPCDVDFEYRVWNGPADEGEDHDSDWQNVYEDENLEEITQGIYKDYYLFRFDEECYHRLDLRATDCLGQVKYHNETFFVDDQAPYIEKKVGEPNCITTDVLVLYADKESNSMDVYKKLSAYQYVDIDLYDVNQDTPTLAELQNYDAVLVYSNRMYNDPEALGDVLADYADNGGGVVVAAFSWNTHSGGDFRLKGRYMNESYGSIPYGDYSPYSSGSLGTIYEPTHPIMQAVTSFSTPNFRSGTSALNPGATLLAEYDDEQVLVSINDTSGTYRTCALGFLPPSDEVISTGSWDSSTDGDLLMHNALRWVAGQNVNPDADKECVTTDTEITIDAWDQGCCGILENVSYRIENSTGWGPWIDILNEVENGEYTFTFKEECYHKLQIQAKDCLGNTETDTETFSVDDKAPYIEKTVGDPNCTEDEENYCVTTDTEITIDAWDQGCCGILQNVSYRIWFDGSWGPWKDILNCLGEGEYTFSFDLECHHKLEIQAKDCLGNTATDVETFYVNNQPPMFRKFVGDPNCSKCIPAPSMEYDLVYGDSEYPTGTVNRSMDEENIYFNISIDKNTQYSHTEFQLIISTYPGDGTNLLSQGTLAKIGIDQDGAYFTIADGGLDLNNNGNPETPHDRYGWWANTERNRTLPQGVIVEGETGDFYFNITIPNNWGCGQKIYWAVNVGADWDQEDDNQFSQYPGDWNKWSCKGSFEEFKLGELEYCVTTDTPISIEAMDMGCCINETINIQYKKWAVCDGSEPDQWTNYTEPFKFIGECEHKLIIRAFDCLGNGKEQIYWDIETFYVDEQGPNVIKEVGDPKVKLENDSSGHDQWMIFPDTDITLSVDESTIETGCCPNIDATIKYRYWYLGGWTDWMDYTEPIHLTEGCVHYLEAYAADCLGNAGEVDNETFWVCSPGGDSGPSITFIEPEFGNTSCDRTLEVILDASDDQTAKEDLNVVLWIPGGRRNAPTLYYYPEYNPDKYGDEYFHAFIDIYKYQNGAEISLQAFAQDEEMNAEMTMPQPFTVCSTVVWDQWMQNGWNELTIPPNSIGCEDGIENVLASIDNGNFDLVYYYDETSDNWDMYVYGDEHNDLNEIEPGKTYWVHIVGEPMRFFTDTQGPIVTIDYPADGEDCMTEDISGTACDIETGIERVKLTIYDEDADEYWDGEENWVTDSTRLNVDGTEDWSYDINSINFSGKSGHKFIVTAYATDIGSGCTTTDSTWFYYYIPEFTEISLNQSTDQGTWDDVTRISDYKFTMCLNSENDYHYIDINNSGTDTNTELKEGYYPFYLDTNNLPDNFYSYWSDNDVYEGCTGDWEPTMWDIINGTEPMMYLHVDGAQNMMLVDGLQYLLGDMDEHLRVNGDYPAGSYNFTGTVTADCAEIESELITINIIFTQCCVEPLMPQNPNPTDGETNVEYGEFITLSYETGHEFGEPIYRDIFIGTDPDPYNNYLFTGRSGPNSLTGYQPAGSNINFETQPSTTYYWQIVVEAECGSTITGPVWEFTTKEQCVEEIDLTKKVWNETSETWEDSINVETDNVITFNITISTPEDACSTCNGNITDLLPAGLSYIDGSTNITVLYDDQTMYPIDAEPLKITDSAGLKLVWNETVFGAPMELPPGIQMYIEFNATITSISGTLTNTAVIYATYDCEEEPTQMAEDAADVNVVSECTPSYAITKYTWYWQYEEWYNSYGFARMDDNYASFKIEFNNTGDCSIDGDITIKDILPENLTYDENYTVDKPGDLSFTAPDYNTPMNTLYFNFTGMMQAGETITITFNAYYTGPCYTDSLQEVYDFTETNHVYASTSVQDTIEVSDTSDVVYDWWYGS